MSHNHPHKHTRHKRVMVVKKQANPKLIDRLTYIVAIVEPLVEIPQIYAIYHGKTAAGVSISAWLGFEVFTAIWIWYALVHREKMIFIYQTLYFILDAVIIYGAFKYGGHW